MLRKEIDLAMEIWKLNRRKQGDPDVNISSFAQTALVLATLSLAACSSTPAAAPAPAAPAATALPKTLEDAVSSPARTQENTKRDQYRHPVETLKFFGITSEMTVVEIQPASGWYTEILAPYLATSGHYVAAMAKGKEDPALTAWITAHPEAKVQSGDFTLPSSTEIIAPGTADLVLTFRNVHNWLSRKNEKAAFAAFFKALKPGGTLGVVEHRANAKSKTDADGHNGYVPEKLVMELAKKAGFKFVAKSEINANAKDTKNYPEGVWTLPPTYKLGDKNHERYAAIGESDRMTLKFVKQK
jgi:predicted methyltransferase